MKTEDIRNIAIIAHVDHGKTTLVDNLLKQSSAEKELAKSDDRVMDSNAIEKERGITILSKCTGVRLHRNNSEYAINIVDTPGHSDFGSEVERVLNIVDGAVLLVDAAEGPMPQTRFVLRKAVERKIKIIIFINKIDRADQRAKEVAMDTWMELVSSEESYSSVTILYGSGRGGYCSKNMEDAKQKGNLEELFEAIISEIPYPQQLSNKPQMLVSIIGIDKYLGKLVIGRVTGPGFSVGNKYCSFKEGKLIETFRITNMFYFLNTKRVPHEGDAVVGEIIAICGSEISTVNCVIGSEDVDIISGPSIEPPTISVTIGANKSQFKGREGSKLTTNQIKRRLEEESETNVGITLQHDGDNCIIFARGELQIEVLIEQMRREGFEVMISRPRVVTIKENGVEKEPVEQVTVISPYEYSNLISESINRRGGNMVSYLEMNDNKNSVKLLFNVPTRGLLGFGNAFLTLTKGEGIYSKSFFNYEPISSGSQQKTNGFVFSMANGKVTSYALDDLNDRIITWFVQPGDMVYEGMVIGIANKQFDLKVNPTREKQLTNVRSVSKDKKLEMGNFTSLSIAGSIGYVSSSSNDQGKIIIEVTPGRVSMLVL